jgi:site-specific DNA recombinase
MGDGKRDVSEAQGTRRPVFDSYGRLSRVPETGELEKIETQLADNRKVIQRLGGSLGEELSDGLSAWKLGVRRPGWERLLERVGSGESDGIVVWHTDRLFRQPRDLETLIELANKGFRVASAHGERDLSDPDDRFILRIEVAHAARSSDDTSRRLKRRFAAMREAGVAYIGGPRRVGWPGRDLTWTPGPDETDADRPMVSAELVARERAAIRAAADALLAGVSAAQIVREWNAEGLRTATGLEWTTRGLRELMLRPANGGLIEYDGQLVARMDGEPIVDPRVFERVRALYAGRRRGRTVGERYVGTGILRCGRCERTLSAKKLSSVDAACYPGTEQRKAVYFCNPGRRGCGKVYIDVRATDRRLKALAASRLSDPDHAAAITAAREQVAEELAQVEQEIRQCEQLQRALADRLGRREIDLDAFDLANEPLAEDLARLRARRDELKDSPDAITHDGTGSTGRPVQVQSAEEIADQWEHGSISERRGLLLSALGSSVVFVDPFERGGKRVFDPTRIRVVNRRR